MFARREGSVKGKEIGMLEGTKQKMLCSSLHLRSPVYLTWLMLVFLTISMTISMMVGAVTISPLTVWKVTLSKLSFIESYITADWSRAERQIIWEIRFPRVILAAVVGAGLALVGAVIQALVRNSLAASSILGVSSGASAGATLVIYHCLVYYSL